jgi:hypothetical protein
MSVGVMKEYKLKLRDLRVSHTLGWYIMKRDYEGFAQHLLIINRSILKSESVHSPPNRTVFMFIMNQ